jgi:hypothetical protein
MPARRVKIEVTDNEGNKLTVIFDGRINRGKVVQVLDFVELLGGIPIDEVEKNLSDLSKFDKLHNLINWKFPIGWFTSQEVMIAYEDSFNEPIGLSTVSTYLSRLSNRGFLMRAGSMVERKYKLRKRVRRKKSPIKS